MGYRDELGAAQARIEDLKGEVKRLEQIKAPDKASRRRFRGLVIIALMMLGVAVAVLVMFGNHEAAAAHEEANALSGRIHMLRQESEARQLEKVGFTRETNAGERLVEERRSQLAQLDARITDRRHQLDLLAPTSVPAASPVRPRRLTEAQIAERLALCTPVRRGGSAEYLYAEGVVIRRDVELREGLPSERFTVRFSDHDEIFSTTDHDNVLGHKEVGLSQEFDQYLFWRRVEVGDIMGVTWYVQHGPDRAVAFRTTDK